MKGLLGILLIIASLILVVYVRIEGIDYTEGQILLHYWKEMLTAFTFAGLGSWLMT